MSSVYMFEGASPLESAFLGYNAVFALIDPVTMTARVTALNLSVFFYTASRLELIICQVSFQKHLNLLTLSPGSNLKNLLVIKTCTALNQNDQEPIKN